MIIKTQHITICGLQLKFDVEFVALKAYSRKEKRFKNNYLSFCLNKFKKKKKQIKPKLSRRK